MSQMSTLSPLTEPVSTWFKQLRKCQVIEKNGQTDEFLGTVSCGINDCLERELVGWLSIGFKDEYATWLGVFIILAELCALQYRVLYRMCVSRFFFQ